MNPEDLRKTVNAILSDVCGPAGVPEELTEALDSLTGMAEEHHYMQVQREADKNGLFIGDKVMVRSNENDPLLVAYYDCRYRSDKATGPAVVTKADSSREQLICFGKVLKYNDQVFNYLSRFSGKEQWDMLCRHNIRTPYLGE